MRFTYDLQQQQVINHNQGHSLILAGAGSGKTASIVERAVRLIQSGINPNGIVMVTFTNKAAREMRQRIFMKLKELNIESDPPLVTTFHGFGQRLIHKNPEACGRVGQPSLLEEDDQSALFTTSLRKFCSDFETKIADQFYEKIRNKGLSANLDDDLPSIKTLLKQLCNEMDNPPRWEFMLQGFMAYEDAKKLNNALDYHDLLILPIHALKSDQQLLAKCQRLIKDLTVDEAQDTNLAQYELIKLLAPPTSPNQTVTMIGDEDQSIHRWRGANPENLRLFNREYSPVIFRLEHNYRSDPEIVSRADRVIQNNQNRFEKRGIPVRKSHEAPVIYQVSPEAEAMSDAIADKIKQAIDGGVAPNEIAILYRTNRMATLLEPALIAKGIPYQIYNGQDLLGRSEAKLLLAAIRLAINPFDRLAFNRLSEIMPKVGKKVLDAIENGMSEHRSSVFDEALKLPKAQQDSVMPMLESIYHLRNAGPRRLDEWVKAQPEMQSWVIKKAHSGLKQRKINKPEVFDIWKKFNRNEPITPDQRLLLADKSNIKSCENYQKNLNEAMSNITERMRLVWRTIDERCSQLPTTATLQDHWFEANGVIAAPPDEENKKPSVHLMSIHASKGLEFKEVHLAGFSNGILPLNIESNADIDHLEDERRLAYVGITRAKDKLHIHHAAHLNLMDGKGYRYVKPSMFADEAGLIEPVEQELVEVRRVSF